jgi:dUTP pyrophosphatase
MKIRIVNKSKHKLPEYTTEYSAGMDIRANIDEDIVLEPMKRTMVRTGLFLEIPVGYEAQIRPGSGLAINKGITVPKFSRNNRRRLQGRGLHNTDKLIR